MALQKKKVLSPLLQNKSTSTPTSPGPRTHSTPSIPVLTGQSGLYSPQYISYIPQIHMGPAVQVGERLGEPRKVLSPAQSCSIVDEQPVEPQFLSLGASDVSISRIQFGAWAAGQVPGCKR